MGNRVFVTSHCPGTVRNFKDIHKLPVADVDIRDPEIIPYGWTDIQTSIVVSVWAEPLNAKDVLPMVGLEGSRIFPLSITNTPPVPYRHPVTFANRPAIVNEAAFEPGDHLGSLRLCVVIIHVIVRQSYIKEVLFGYKGSRNKTRSLYRIIRPSVVIDPIYIPGALGIRNRVAYARLFSHPKHSHRNLILPRHGAAVKVPAWQRTII